MISQLISLLISSDFIWFPWESVRDLFHFRPLAWCKMLPCIKPENQDSDVFLHPFSPLLAAYISMGGAEERAWLLVGCVAGFWSSQVGFILVFMSRALLIQQHIFVNWTASECYFFLGRLCGMMGMDSQETWKSQGKDMLTKPDN